MVAVASEPSIEQRLDELENRRTYRLTLRPVDLLRLAPGDIAVLRIKRPIAEDERRALIDAWRQLMDRTGHSDTELVILAGADLDLKVVRKEGSVECNCGADGTQAEIDDHVRRMKQLPHNVTSDYHGLRKDG